MSEPLPPPAPTGPRVGDSKMIDGVLHVWDGTEWVPAPRPTSEE